MKRPRESHSVPRRGGLRQRLAGDHAHDAPATDHSVLFTVLLTMFAWGEMSPQQCQRLAAAAMEDVKLHAAKKTSLKQLQTMAEIGTSGRFPNKCYADLMRTMPIKVETPEPFYMKLPSTNGLVTQAMMLPHEMFSAIYHRYRAVWEKCICPSGDAAHSFWRTNVMHPAMKAAGFFKTRPGWPQRYIPLSFHGDDVPVSGRGKIWSHAMTTFSWSSMLGVGTTDESQFFIFGLFDRLNAHNAEDTSKDTLHCFFELLAWSFQALADGKWPSRDHRGRKYEKDSEKGRLAGTDLAGGYCGVLWGIIGDLDYFCKTLTLPKSTLASGPCCLCKCTGRGANTWCDFSRTAPWRQACWEVNDWRAWSGRSRCPIFNLEWASPWLVGLDWMHNKYLGHDQFVYGSLFKVLVRYLLPSANPLKNLATVWQDILYFYKRWNAPCRFGAIKKLTMFERKSGWPKLRGKAGEIRHLAGAMHYVWQKHYNQRLEVHRQVELYLRLNMSLEETLTEHKESYALPPAAAAVFEETVTTMLQVLTSVAEHYLEEKLFNLTQKSHFMQHSALLAKYISPRVLWCFQGEDMQKQMSGQNMHQRANARADNDEASSPVQNRPAPEA